VQTRRCNHVQPTVTRRKMGSTDQDPCTGLFFLLNAIYTALGVRLRRPALWFARDRQSCCGF
jgi:hypothetical protein